MDQFKNLRYYIIKWLPTGKYRVVNGAFIHGHKPKIAVIDQTEWISVHHAEARLAEIEELKKDGKFKEVEYQDTDLITENINKKKPRKFVKG